MSTKIKILLTICSLFAVNKLSSQNHFGILMDASHTVQFAVEANPIANLKIDYLYKCKDVKLFNQPIGIGGSISIPPFAFQEGFDINYSLGASTLIPIKSKFKLLSTANLNFYHISDLSASYFSYGPQLDLFPGFYQENWAFALHFSFDYRPFVRIKHKAFSSSAFEDLYHSTTGIYTKPLDGWFFQNHHFGNYGIAIVHKKEKFNINFTLDYSCPLTELGFKIIPELGMLPFSSTIGFSYNLK